MPAITVSAVTAATDTITAAAHGLVTGDRFRLRNIGGGLPAGLASVTDYFAILVDASNIKPAASSALALAGTPINITTAGTGTHLIEYGLPYAIPRIATSGSRVFPQDDNAAWNALVAIYDLLTGQAQSVWTDVRFSVPIRHGTITLRIPAMLGKPQNNTIAWTLDAGGVLGVPFPQWAIPIDLPDGKRITAVRARLKDSATGPTRLSLITTKSVDAVETGFGGAGTTSSGSGAFQTLTRSGLTETISAGTIYYAGLLLNTGTALCNLQWIEVDYDDL